MRRRGLSLIEVMISMTVLSVAVLALIGIFPTMTRLNKNTMLATQALYVAQEEMDRRLVANALVSTAGVVTPIPALPSGSMRTVGAADPLGNAGLQAVTVEVTWVENGRPRLVTLTSMVAP